MKLKGIAISLTIIALGGGAIGYHLRPNKLILDENKQVFKDYDAIAWGEKPAWVYEGYASKLKSNVKFIDIKKDGILDAIEYSYKNPSEVEVTTFFWNDQHEWNRMWSQILQYEKNMKNQGSKLPAKKIEF